MSVTRELLVYLRERYADAEAALAELDAIETATMELADAVRRGHEHEVDEALSALVTAVFPVQPASPGVSEPAEEQ